MPYFAKKTLQGWETESRELFGEWKKSVSYNFGFRQIQIPTRTPEKIVVALFSGILVNSGIQVEA